MRTTLVARVPSVAAVGAALLMIMWSTPARAVAIDFNSDGHADILWHNGASGALQVWYMNDVTRIGAAQPDSSLNVPNSSGWSVVGLNDFNQDGHIDILWHNATSGASQVWYMNNLTRLGATNLDSSLNVPDSSGWHVVGTNDFDLDGHPDILWHNGISGENQIWYMNNLTRLSAFNLDSSLNVANSTGWSPVGTNDFNLDGHADILWHNEITGATQVWYMSNRTRIGAADIDHSLNVPSSTGWHVVGTDDLNLDGHADILWHNGSTGETQVWYMSNLARIGFTDLDISLNLTDDSGWRVVDGTLAPPPCSQGALCGNCDLCNDGNCQCGSSSCTNPWVPSCSDTNLCAAHGGVNPNFDCVVQP